MELPPKKGWHADLEPNSPAGASLFAGGGEMGERVRTFDWSRTPLGPIESWSPALRMMTGFLLANRFPLLLWWGPQFIQIYNDAYRPVLGAKHPNPGLGRPLSECWSEIWHVLRPLVETPFNGGPATWMEDIFLEINRHGFTEETHFTIAYSPVPDETVPTGIGGVLATVHEITENIINERRIALLRDLGAHSAKARTAKEACENAAAAFRDSKDIPFVLFYLLDSNRKNARLAALSGIGKGTEMSPNVIPLDHDSPWPAREVLETEQIKLVESLSKKFKDVPCGPWSVPAHAAAVVPIRSNMHGQPAGFIIAGLSPRRRYDAHYTSFLDLVSTQVATAVANARSYEEERKRAEALAELDRAKTTFFSNVSHELRTPLTLMLGPIEDELREHPETRPRLELVHRNSLRLLKLVNTLLDFARIEAGRVQANFEPTDLSAYTADLASGFRSAMESAGLQFVVDCPPLPEPIFVDREMWEKVVLNLLSNAFKFTLKGSVAINLRFRGDSIEFTVSDTGAGIPSAELPRIFERFHRARSTQARTHEGTGIGLALVQELVRLLGGEIRVNSVEGQGTVFTVNLPTGSKHVPKNLKRATKATSTAVGQAPFLQEASSWLPESTKTSGAGALNPIENYEPPPASRRPGKILVAEDNADMRHYITGLLREHYTVTAVGDGQAALEAIRVARPDLVLSDIMMPRLDGFELLRELRSNADTQTIPVILLSARAGEEARVEGISRQANDYLVKPFSARELFARVSTHLELAQVRREAEAALRERENRFHTWLQASTNIMYCMSADWREMRLLVGKDFIADTKDPNLTWLEKYIHPDDQKRVMAAIQDAIRTRTPFQLEHRVIKKDGATGWVSSHAIPLLDDRGEIIEWFGAASDISVRKEAEQKMAELLEREKAARQVAETATRMKDHFLATLSHELRTPLNPVLLIASDSVENEALPAEVRAQFEVILKNIEVEARLIDDLLDLSRINHGKLNLKLRTVDAHGVLQEAINTVQDRLREKRIRGSFKLDASRHQIRADAVRLQQIFWNVLNNAIKFTPEDGQISVETFLPNGDGHFGVKITDTGIGMTAVELERIFLPFSQGDHSNDKSGKYGGLGLGLALSKKLVELHSGNIHATSEGRYRGCSFVIEFPLAPAG
jgi:signal transduction histidine kinase